jgi:murein DD-endopeptidase MepM/ murein hydrolase activator NlpD
MNRVAQPARYRKAAAGVVGCLLLGSALGAGARPEPGMAAGGEEPQAVATLRPDTPAAVEPEDQPATRRLYQELFGRQGQRLVTYTVAEGDSLWSIAQTYGIDWAQLLAANPDVNPDALQIGAQIQVPTAETGAGEERDERLAMASRGGQVRREVTTRFTAPAEPPPAPPAPKDDQPAQPAASNTDWIWPVSGGVHTSEFGPRHGGFHAGLDIAVPTGTPAVAARAGKVAFAGWDGGYGYCVIIDHGDGFKTRYAHASTLLVTSGQSVSAGDPVIKVGSTGNSTGPHLHFEVIENGKPQNPRKFLR